MGCLITISSLLIVSELWMLPKTPTWGSCGRDRNRTCPPSLPREDASKARVGHLRWPIDNTCVAMAVVATYLMNAFADTQTSFIWLIAHGIVRRTQGGNRTRVPHSEKGN